MAMFQDATDEFFAKLAFQVRQTFQPVIDQLVEQCPDKRLSITDLAMRLGFILTHVLMLYPSYPRLQ